MLILAFWSPPLTRTTRTTPPAPDRLTTEYGLLVTTGLVIAETAYLLDRELGPAAEATLYQSIIEGHLIVQALTTDDWRRIYTLAVQYADLRLGGTDASLIAVAERYRAPRVATLNRRHFTVVRPAHVDAFTVLPHILLAAAARLARLSAGERDRARTRDDP